jgi:hypothetical protein
MAGGPQVVGEGAHAGGQPLGVVEEQDLGHGGPPGRMVGRLLVVWRTASDDEENDVYTIAL